MPGARCFSWTVPDNQIHRIGLDGNHRRVPSYAGHANSLSIGPTGALFAVSSQTGEVMSYDTSGKGSRVVDGLRGQHILATPNRRTVRHQSWRQAGGCGGRLVRQGRHEDAGGLGFEVGDWTGLSPRSAAPVRGRRSVEVGVQLSDQRRRHAQQQGAPSACMSRTGKTTQGPGRFVTPERGRCWSRRGRVSRRGSLTMDPTQAILPIPWECGRLHRRLPGWKGHGYTVRLLR